jgi:hypothetical protein
VANNALGPQRDEHGLFIQGVSGNPAGRPVGARNKLGEAFIQALHESFVEHGATAIQTVIDEKPEQYLKVIASLCPKELSLTINNDAEDLSDDELRERIRKLTNRLAPFVDGTGIADSGASAQEGEASSSRVH